MKKPKLKIQKKWPSFGGAIRLTQDNRDWVLGNIYRKKTGGGFSKLVPNCFHNDNLVLGQLYRKILGGWFFKLVPNSFHNDNLVLIANSFDSGNGLGDSASVGEKIHKPKISANWGEYHFVGFFFRFQRWERRSKRWWWIWFCCRWCYLLWVQVLGLVKFMEELFVIFVGILLLDLKIMFLKVSLYLIGVYVNFISFWLSLWNCFSLYC